MGNYLNPGNEGFRRAVNSEIQVDKTGLLKYTNKVIGTMQEYLCVSRPRRFGKSMAAAMLAAYYDRECDSRDMFSSFEIAESEGFEKRLNRYDVIFLNMQEFLSQSEDISYVGFTEQEVERLCGKYGMDVEEVKNWYDGYSFEEEPCLYSPRSGRGKSR